MASSRLLKKPPKFDVETFLTNVGKGRRILSLPAKHVVFTQGSSCDSLFYLQTGKVKLTVVSKIGKEATIGILNPGDFFGEGCLAGQPIRPDVIGDDDDRMPCHAN
jgi:CRP/FNR family cyclic AMP-dependent transcriptional regulator